MDRKTFAKLVKLLGKFACKEAVPPTLTFHGTKFASMDTPRVRLLELELPTNDETRRISGSYEVEFDQLKELAKEQFDRIFLYRVHKGKMMFKVTDGWGQKPKIRSIPAERVNEDLPPKLKERRFKTKVEIPPEPLRRTARVAEFLKADKIVIIVDKKKQRVHFEIPEEEYGEEEYYRKSAMILGGKARKGKACYQARTLVDLIALLDCGKCEIGFFRDNIHEDAAVLRVTLEDFEYGKIRYYVAPIIMVD